jgi:hypothetical protein
LANSKHKLRWTFWPCAKTKSHEYATVCRTTPGGVTRAVHSGLAATRLVIAASTRVRQTSACAQRTAQASQQNAAASTSGDGGLSATLDPARPLSLLKASCPGTWPRRNGRHNAP